jgi:hypothetical protein
MNKFSSMVEGLPNMHKPLGLIPALEKKGQIKAYVRQKKY